MIGFFIIIFKWHYWIYSIIFMLGLLSEAILVYEKQRVDFRLYIVSITWPSIRSISNVIVVCRIICLNFHSWYCCCCCCQCEYLCINVFALIALCRLKLFTMRGKTKCGWTAYMAGGAPMKMNILPFVIASMPNTCFFRLMCMRLAIPFIRSVNWYFRCESINIFHSIIFNRWNIHMHRAGLKRKKEAENSYIKQFFRSW